jgi:hypothetical protein
MRIFIPILIIYGALLCIGALVIARFIWMAEVYPCDHCGSNPAAHELPAGRQLCECCYLAWEKDRQSTISPSREDPTKTQRWHKQ